MESTFYGRRKKKYLEAITNEDLSLWRAFYVLNKIVALTLTAQYSTVLCYLC